jgi:hypothetical protein
MFAKEKQHLIKQAQRLEFSGSQQLRVDKYAAICYRTNRYSASDKLAGRSVDVKIHGSRLGAFYDNGFIAGHNRVCSKHQWVITVEHCLDAFKRKPGALSGSLALAGRSQLKKIYDTYFTGFPRDFIGLLHYCHQNQIADLYLAATVEKLANNGRSAIASEKLIALLGNKPSMELGTPNELDQTSHLAINHLKQTAQLMG